MTDSVLGVDICGAFLDYACFPQGLKGRVPRSPEGFEALDPPLLRPPFCPSLFLLNAPGVYFLVLEPPPELLLPNPERLSLGRSDERAEGGR